MRQRGHRLLLACDPRGALYPRAERQGFAVFPLNFGGLRNAGAWLNLRRLLKQERVDLLNTHSSLDSWVGLLAWLTSGEKTTLLRTRHLSTPVAANWPTRRLYLAPAAVITTGQGISELLHQRLGVPRERLHAIPTGVSLAEFSPGPLTRGWPPALICRREFSSSGPFRCCVPGRDTCIFWRRSNSFGKRASRQSCSSSATALTASSSRRKSGHWGWPGRCAWWVTRRRCPTGWP